MKKFWHWITYLGVNNKRRNLDSRTNMLSNQLNFVILAISVITVSILHINNMLIGNTMGIGSKRIVVLAFLALVNLFLSYQGRNNLSRPLLIYLTPIILIIFPTIMGFVENESYIYYPYMLIALSLLPQMLYHPLKERRFYLTALIYYLILVVSIDNILNHFSEDTLQLPPIIEEFYLTYKIAIIIIYAFITISVGYLRGLNRTFEDRLNKQNKNLDLHNEQLKNTLVELKKTQQQLIQAEKISSIGSLTSGIAYEINAPLAKIASGLEFIEKTHILEKDPDNPKVQNGYNLIKSGLTESVAIVESMFNFLLEENSPELSKNLNSIVSASIEQFEKVGLSRIPIHANLRLEKSTSIYPDKMRKAFDNILSFAIRTLENSTKVKKEIQLSTFSKTENRIEYAIVQFDIIGAYLPERIIKKIFDPYVYGSTQNSSLSLELSQSYSIITDHKGLMQVENKENSVCFTAKIPIRDN